MILGESKYVENTPLESSQKNILRLMVNLFAFSRGTEELERAAIEFLAKTDKLKQYASDFDLFQNKTQAPSFVFEMKLPDNPTHNTKNFQQRKDNFDRMWKNIRLALDTNELTAEKMVNDDLLGKLAHYLIYNDIKTGDDRASHLLDSNFVTHSLFGDLYKQVGEYIQRNGWIDSQTILLRTNHLQYAK